MRLESRDSFSSTPCSQLFYVHPQHEEAFLRNHERIQRRGRQLVLIVVSLLVVVPGVEIVTVVLGALSVGIVIIGIAVSLLGVVFILYPFATPETVALLGLRRSIIVVRWCGLVTVILGLVVAVIGIS